MGILKIREVNPRSPRPPETRLPILPIISCFRFELEHKLAVCVSLPENTNTVNLCFLGRKKEKWRMDGQEDVACCLFPREAGWGWGGGGGPLGIFWMDMCRPGLQIGTLF